MAYAKQCLCGHSSCKDWHVHPHAALQGVKFTENQAKIVAAVLSGTAVVVLCEDTVEAEKVQRIMDSSTTSEVPFAILLDPKKPA